MITPWNESYKRTKAIKIGAAQLESPFCGLVDWLNQFYEGIGALNAWVEIGPKLVVVGKSALRIAFERDAAVERLNLGPYKQNPSESERILAEFHRIVVRRKLSDFDTNDLFVTYSSFVLLTSELQSRLSQLVQLVAPLTQGARTGKALSFADRFARSRSKLMNASHPSAADR